MTAGGADLGRGERGRAKAEPYKRCYVPEQTCEGREFSERKFREVTDGGAEKLLIHKFIYSIKNEFCSF